MEMLLMIGAIIAGSAVSLLGGSLIFTTKKRREKAILFAMPFGAGALLAAAFFDLLPEAFELGEPRELLLWALGGFLVFFVFERSASWFHRHHDHDEKNHDSQRKLIVFGDLMHNAIDGAAIGAAFVVSPALGIITTIAVSAHEIPKELGTFALLLSRGWKDKTVIIANILTAVATIVAAVVVYSLGSDEHLPLAIMLAATAGFFIYVAASDIIPDIHEQSHRTGMLQAAVLVISVILIGGLISYLHSGDLHAHSHTAQEVHHVDDHHSHPGDDQHHEEEHHEH